MAQQAHAIWNNKQKSMKQAINYDVLDLPFMSSLKYLLEHNILEFTREL